MTDIEEAKNLDVKDYLQARAKDIVLARNGNVAKAGPGLDAQVSHEMFVQSVEARQLFRDFQGQLAAYTFREHLWVHYPHYSFADDYRGFRAFLASTGLGDSTVTELAALFWVVPLCDAQDMEIDRYLGPGEWTKTRETITALKRAARDGKTGQVRLILKDIDKTQGSATTTARASLRQKYRQQHKAEKPGHGTTAVLPDGRQAVVVVFAAEEDLKKALVRLGPMTEWDLRLIRLEATCS